MLQVLRLDRLHALVSGNKWLKLQGWWPLLQKGGYGGIFTKGGPWSNHVHASAAFCRQAGLGFTAIIKGQAANTAMLHDVENMGGTLLFRHGRQYTEADAEGQALAAAANYLWLPMGAEGEPAVAGVQQYLNAVPGHYGQVWCAVGSGSTATGIWRSALSFDELVLLMPGMRDAALEQALLALPQRYPRAATVRVLRLPGDRFGKLLPGQTEAMLAAWQQHQLPLDVVYTGKLWLALQTEALQNRWASAASVLFIHTGGLQGNRSVPALAALQPAHLYLPAHDDKPSDDNEV